MPRFVSFCLVCLAVATLGLTGCASLAPLDTDPARPRTVTPHSEVLRDLPDPADKVVAAVYRFRDQTGQYKPTNGGSSFSTAVTQGATSILIQALDESGWFIPIEREGLSNLLNERQIIQTTRAQNSTPDAPAPGLPPLLFAGVLIEGGIIGYDTNVLTGGMGARYLGMGTSGQYRQDQVTIYLRAVSTQTGRVLKTIHTTKTIVSQQLDASFFRYVDVNKILEAEVGYTYNEPNVVAVTEAIEEAVVGLVLEGVRENLWGLADANDLTDDAFAAYDARIADAARRDAIGRVIETPTNPISVSLTAGAQLANSDYADPLVRPAAGLEVRYGLTPRLEAGVRLSGGGLAADRSFDRVQGAAEAVARYTVLPRASLTPFFSVGVGALLLVDSAEDPTQPLVPTVSGSAGFAFAVGPQVRMTVALANTYALQDVLDDIERGAYHDNVWTLQTGISFYFN